MSDKFFAWIIIQIDKTTEFLTSIINYVVMAVVWVLNNIMRLFYLVLLAPILFVLKFIFKHLNRSVGPTMGSGILKLIKFKGKLLDDAFDMVHNFISYIINADHPLWFVLIKKIIFLPFLLINAAFGKLFMALLPKTGMFTTFFGNKKYQKWSVLGSAIILWFTWYKVQMDVVINTWFGEFYDIIQKGLPGNNGIVFDDLLNSLLFFAGIAAVLVALGTIIGFLKRHYVFRWRTAMTEYYSDLWPKLRHIEGASQRIQEDTMRFAAIVEGLGIALIDSAMTFAAFLPILWTMSSHVTELPWIGHVEQGLVFIAFISVTFATVGLRMVGFKLPGLEFNNQRVEAAYRKEFVIGEDDHSRAKPQTLKELYSDVRKNYFTLYLHYMYFDLVKYSYLQASVVLPYIALGPTIVSGTITLGIMQQIIRAFGKVEESLQFLVNSWSTIVELMSIHKRLKAFESEIK
jgi:peptide/bleomycin uptake transporter